MDQRVEAIKRLSEQLPLNDLGLPEGIYRPDLLPDVEQVGLPSRDLVVPSDTGVDINLESHPSHPLISLEDLQAAYMPLSYAEGFPSLPDGRPLWSRLDFEPIDAYSVLEVYLLQGLQGARQLHLLPEAASNGHKYSAAELQDYFHLYYWSPRARAYDLFRAAHARRVRQERALKVEDNHFLVAERLLEVCNSCLSVEGFMEGVSAQGLASLVKTAAQLQRVSVGLPAHGPSSQGADRLGPPMHMVSDSMRDLAQPPGEDAESSIETAEDVVRRVLQLNQQININVGGINGGADPKNVTVDTKPTSGTGPDKWA